MKNKLFENVEGNVFRLTQETELDDNGVDWNRLNKELDAAGWEEHSLPEYSDRRIYRSRTNLTAMAELYEHNGFLFAYLWDYTGRFPPQKEMRFPTDVSGKRLGTDLSNELEAILDR